MEMGITKKSYGNRKTILISQDSYHVSLPIKLSGTAGATIKAGQPLVGDLASRLSVEFTAGTENASGILLHDVVLDSNGKANGTIVIAGCIDKLKLESDVVSALTSAKSSGLDNIIVVEGSAI